MKWLIDFFNLLGGLPSSEVVDNALTDSSVVQLLDKKWDVGVAVEYVEIGSCRRRCEREAPFMHQPIRDRLFRVEVVCDADVQLLSSELKTDESTVESRFVTSGMESFPLVDQSTLSRQRGARNTRRVRLPARAAARASALSRPANLNEVSLALRQLQQSADSERESCGFVTVDDEAYLSCSQHLVELVHSGCTATLLSAAKLRPGNPVFFEIFIMEKQLNMAGAHCGVTIGLTDKNHKKNSVIGGTNNSLGFACNGDVISDAFWRTYDYRFFADDTIGFLVTFPGSDEYAFSDVTANPSNSDSSHEDEDDASSNSVHSNGEQLAKVSIYINGKRIEGEPVPFSLESLEDLRAGVSLSRVGVKAEIRCCSHDLRMVPWDQIPACTSSLSGTTLLK